MSSYYVEESAVIDAPPRRVYDILADYQEGHPSILPQQYFKRLDVLQGGRGEGTVIYVVMKALGATAEYTMTVTEPQPGRVLQEEDESAGVLTTFTVDPLDDGARSRVTIATKARTASGIRGQLEKLITTPVSRRIYRQELQQLAQVAQSQGTAGGFA